jgi:hypothetical protein
LGVGGEVGCLEEDGVEGAEEAVVGVDHVEGAVLGAVGVLGRSVSVV